MAPQKRGSTWLLVIGLAVAGGGLPIVLYWASIGRVPTVSTSEAQELLAGRGDEIMLVDVRSPSDFRERHVTGAANWPFDEIAALASSDGVPSQFQEKELLLICDAGLRSALAVRKLRELGLRDVWNIQGGLQAWVAGGKKPCGAALCSLETETPGAEALPFKNSPSHEQWAAFAAGMVVKPIYMLIALILAVILRRQQSRDLVSLRWALIAFFVGEACCAVNYWIYGEESHLLEYLHSYGMVLTFGFMTYALCEGLDLRIVRYSDESKKCAALGLCGSCIKYADVPCGLRRLFLFLIPANILLACMPLGAEPEPVCYNTRILGTLYTYVHHVPHQLFEMRYCPILAIVLLSASLLVMVLKRGDPVPLAKVLFAAGLAPLAFGMLRLFLLAAYAENMVWFIFWEELTELLFVVGVAVALWLFRHGLFRQAIDLGRD